MEEEGDNGLDSDEGATYSDYGAMEDNDDDEVSSNTSSAVQPFTRIVSECRSSSGSGNR